MRWSVSRRVVAPRFWEEGGGRKEGRRDQLVVGVWFRLPCTPSWPPWRQRQTRLENLAAGVLRVSGCGMEVRCGCDCFLLLVVLVMVLVVVVVMVVVLVVFLLVIFFSFQFNVTILRLKFGAYIKTLTPLHPYTLTPSHTHTVGSYFAPTLRLSRCTRFHSGPIYTAAHTLGNCLARHGERRAFTTTTSTTATTTITTCLPFQRLFFQHLFS
ncbi:hypothetical protein E2C01_057847 [Portunus trituberculatus]|uniref:Uncharacterized protein n=1 Tax=Portunus trituberculatus TaxID=210409 RepID=A0A5B7H4H8_PORTR|nr:hypothetical protein [Portunus trituberculatus]